VKETLMTERPQMIDWLTFFVLTIEAIQKPLSEVLQASGCREGWLQGELFRAGQKHNLRVNEYHLDNRQTADVSCGDGPDMLAEIKIVGADYFPKMQGHIKSDVERMRSFSNAITQRYMILIIPNCDAETKLGKYLHSCSFSTTCVERELSGFQLRIWRF
jgi:hypothetical protein